MVWLVTAYVFASIAIAVSAGVNAGVSAGLCAIGASALFTVAGGGLKASFAGDMTQKIGGSVIALVLVLAGRWLSNGFSVMLFGTRLSGEEWGWIGFILCFLSANKLLQSAKTTATEVSAPHPTPKAVPVPPSPILPSEPEVVPVRQLVLDALGRAIVSPDDLLHLAAQYGLIASRVLKISAEEASRRAGQGDGGRFDLRPVVNALKGTRTVPHAVYYAKFHIDEDGEIDSIHHGWCFDSFVAVDGREADIRDALWFAHNLDGILSAHFTSVVLPTIGAFWHGLYERDYTLIKSPEALNEVLSGDDLKEASGDKRAILLMPLGLRIQKTEDGRMV